MVAEAFRKLREAVRGDDGRGLVQGHLKPIDTDEIAQKLDIDQVAAERGTREQPATGSQSLDGVEQQIIQTVESEWSWHGADLINNLRAYGARLIAVSVQTELANLDLLAQNTLARLRDANHRAEAELGPLREAFIAYRDELRDFRERNKLKRAARNPGGRWTTFGLLIFLIGFEAALNGFFFAKGSELGLLGGIGTAIGISFVNVLFAFGLGLFPLRWINHRNLIIKLLGFIFALAGGVGLIALHGFAAHYRDATASVGEGQAFATAIETLRASPLGLADLNSFYLFGIGILWAFLAAWKGAAFDDPYPRYGAHHRRVVHAREAYSDEHAVLFEDLEEIKEETIKALDAGIKRIPLFPQQAAKIRSERDAHIRAFRAYETSVVTAVNQLLARYRDVNTFNRKTPRPQHFDVPWKLSHSFLAEGAALKDIAEPTAPTLDASTAMDELKSLSKAVLDEYEVLMVNYPHPTKMPF
ncbi:hypothetical protein NML43_20440 [Rhodopseudomonas palustris]|uniref:hypothetical protein n=1 Tax=Rhodopseudomonas palustris TaxID=1076 RepID=UPI0020CD14C6|nr:hypothetical protein [Rhodopseudomonas palustris]MCP9629466.1 hypothetical protein [Rhodopseudomonas palustris]